MRERWYQERHAKMLTTNDGVMETASDDPMLV